MAFYVNLSSLRRNVVETGGNAWGVGDHHTQTHKESTLHHTATIWNDSTCCCLDLACFNCWCLHTEGPTCVLFVSFHYVLFLHILCFICFYIQGLTSSLASTNLFFFHSADRHSRWFCFNTHTHTLLILPCIDGRTSSFKPLKGVNTLHLTPLSVSALQLFLFSPLIMLVVPVILNMYTRTLWTTALNHTMHFSDYLAFAALCVCLWAVMVGSVRCFVCVQGVLCFCPD